MRDRSRLSVIHGIKTGRRRRRRRRRKEGSRGGQQVSECTPGHFLLFNYLGNCKNMTEMYET
jgi:hypothetical protein